MARSTEAMATSETAIRTLELERGVVRYTDVGEGPTLLFVHFGPAWSFVWRGLIEQLRGRFRCVSLDFPGSGLSPRSDLFRADPRDATELLESFVKELELHDVTLVLHDLGGPSALPLTVRHADLVRGLVVTESFAWSLAEHNPSVARMLRLVGGRTFMAVNVTTNALALATSGRGGVGKQLSRSERKTFRAPFEDREARKDATRALGAAAGMDDELRALERGLLERHRDLPVLLVFGEKSPTMKDGFPERWRSMFPRARLSVVPGGHHFPMMDDAVGVASEISAWWDDEMTSSSRSR